MASLKVPERYIEGIVKVAQLSEEGFDEFLRALKKAPEFRDVAELSAWIADETPKISSSDRIKILKAITPMFRVQRAADVSPSTFAADIWSSISEDVPDRVNSLDDRLLISRIKQLMELGSLDLINMKIMELKSELERGFCKVRILTDLRPVFKGNIEEMPSTMVILHTLQIGYHDGMGDHKEFYVTLDESDIEALSEALDRASKKAGTLKRLAEKSEFTLG